MNSFTAEPTNEDIVRILLKKTNHDNPPVDVTVIAEYLNLTIEYFQDHEKYNLHKRIKAFLWPEHRLIGVYDNLTHTQKRFSVLHEIGHFVLPEHSVSHELLQDGKIKDDND